MNPSDFADHCHQVAAERARQCGGTAAQPGCDGGNIGPDGKPLSTAEMLIGLFQSFRPDGEGLGDLLEPLPQAPQLLDRILPLYEVAGSGQRPGGGKDAFFVVRDAPELAPELAKQLGMQWLQGLQTIASQTGQHAISEHLGTDIEIRVLQGKAPKHPKEPVDRSKLLTIIADQLPEILNDLHSGAGSLNDADEQTAETHASLLAPAYYFIACDAMLRDYLMWPFLAETLTAADPLQAYFELWSHGVKARSFRDQQLDLYLPMPT